jgi:hypothetical protein
MKCTEEKIVKSNGFKLLSLSLDDVDDVAFSTVPFLNYFDITDIFKLTV